MKLLRKQAAVDVDAMAFVSHQLNTPLTAIRWYAELLSMGKMAKPLDTQQKALMDELLGGVARLGELVNDIQDSSRLERRKFGDDPSSVSVSECMSSILQPLQADIAAKKIALISDVSKTLPQITARKSLVEVILRQLCSNAVKYTPENGSVNITVRVATTEEAKRAKLRQQAGVFISVADTGYGIPVAEHPQVFTKFFRAENVRTLGIEGTGLGLYIVALATRELGGAVWFESTENKGSTFCVVIPL